MYVPTAIVTYVNYRLVRNDRSHTDMCVQYRMQGYMYPHDHNEYWHMDLALFRKLQRENVFKFHNSFALNVESAEKRDVIFSSSVLVHGQRGIMSLSFLNISIHLDCRRLRSKYYMRRHTIYKFWIHWDHPTNAILMFICVS